jgi:hypothetical protein
VESASVCAGQSLTGNAESRSKTKPKRKAHAEQGPEAPPIYAQTIKVPPAFKISVITVAGITVLAMLMYCSVLFLKQPSEEAKGFFETLSTVIKIGIGAVAGLLAGKAAT